MKWFVLKFHHPRSYIPKRHLHQNRMIFVFVSDVMEPEKIYKSPANQQYLSVNERPPVRQHQHGPKRRLNTTVQGGIKQRSNTILPQKTENTPTN